MPREEKQPVPALPAAPPAAPEAPAREGAAPVATGPANQRKPSRAGRNLPAAIGIGLAMGGGALVTLFTVKAIFLAYVGAIVILALTELRHVLRSHSIGLPLIPIVVGGAAMFTLAYWVGVQAALAALAITVVGLLAWRLPGGAGGYVRDVTASIFAVGYLPLMAVFVALMLARPDGAREALIFVLLTVCSDTGAYASGVLFGRHPMAPAISPKKTWEGLAGSFMLCLAAGGLSLPLLLHAPAWQGLVLGAAAVLAATLGDLVESMIKRDLAIKDMGSVLPGHGGILDRIDSLLMVAPVSWLLLGIFLSGR